MRLARLGGFSMVEMVLSLGILSFAFVGLLGLLPIGLTTLHKAIDASVTTQISQRIVDEAQETDFQSYIDPSNPPAVRYFDDQGQELPQQTGSIYCVNVRIQASPTLPGATNGNVNLAEITVQIASNPANKPLTKIASSLWQSDPTIPMTSYSTFLAGNNPPAAL